MAAILLTALARASKALTIGGSVPTANDTVTIGTQVYTWKASTTTTAGEVKIGASVGLSGDYLAAAINGGTGSGTLYGSSTVTHTGVTAVSDGAGVVTVYARIGGLIGNHIPIAEAGTNTAWASSATFLTGGVGNVESLIGAQLTAIEQKMQLNAQMETWVDAMQADLAL